MARARELGIAVKRPESATLKFPAKRGWVEILTEMMDSGDIPPEGVDKLYRAAKARMEADRRAAEGAGAEDAQCPVS